MPFNRKLKAERATGKQVLRQRREWSNGRRRRKKALSGDGRSVKAVRAAECGDCCKGNCRAGRVSVGLAFSKPTLVRVLKC